MADEMMSRFFLLDRFNYEPQRRQEFLEDNQAFYELLLAVLPDMGTDKYFMPGIITFAFSYFPQIRKKSIEAMIKLCTDEDRRISSKAFESLPLMFQHNADFSNDLFPLISRLLRTDITRELKCIFYAINALLRLNPLGTITQIFFMIYRVDDSIRRKYFYYLSTSFQDVDIKPNVEAFLVKKLYKALRDFGSAYDEDLQIILKLHKEGDYLFE